MSAMKYEGEMGRIQRALAQCHDAVVRRTSVMDSLNLRTGERSLEFGCGGGFYAYEAAQFVGPTGQVRAVDLSEDQIAAARERCADLPWLAFLNFPMRMQRLMWSMGCRCWNMCPM